MFNKYKTKKDFLRERLEQVSQEIADLDIELEILDNYPPKDVVSKEQITANSSKDITAEEATKRLVKRHSTLSQRENAILSLLQK